MGLQIGNFILQVHLSVSVVELVKNDEEIEMDTRKMSGDKEEKRDKND